MAVAVKKAEALEVQKCINASRIHAGSFQAQKVRLYSPPLLSIQIAAKGSEGYPMP